MAMEENDLREKIRDVIEWWENQECPKCGGLTDTNAQWCGNCHEWHPLLKEEDRAWCFCTVCGFKHYLSHDLDRLPDELYLEEIKTIVEKKEVINK